MANLLVFWSLRAAEVAGAGVAFYIWVGIFGLFVVSQFWAFAADLYCDERGRRLLPMIAIGATAGAVTGSLVAEKIVHSGILDASASSGGTPALTASIGLTTAADRRGPAGEGSALPRRAAGANDTGTTNGSASRCAAIRTSPPWRR
jgi:AAA family ATP:ADP antiporter